MIPLKPVYVFLDESGNFHFSASGSKYLTLGCVTYRRDCSLYSDLIDLRYDLLEEGLVLDRFHATEDRQKV